MVLTIGHMQVASKVCQHELINFPEAAIFRVDMIYCE